MTPTALLTLTAITAAAIFTAQQQQQDSNGLKIMRPNGSEVTLPFTGLKHPAGVTVDAAGNVYVVDYGNSRVVKLAADHSSTQAVLPSPG